MNFTLKQKHLLVTKSAYVLILAFTFQIFSPLTVLALTSGPSQPEFSTFEQATTTEMVDAFSGDFTYNLPLFEIPGPNGGYPLNLSYHAGPSMEQEASWVGLGWDLNVGAINRVMRGLPDEFNGSDMIKKYQHSKPNVTVGLNIQPVAYESFGFGKVSLGNISCFYNSYKGVGYSIGFGVSFKAPLGKNISSGLGLNVTVNTQEGVDLAPSLSLSAEYDTRDKEVTGKTSMSLGANFNSIDGYKGMSFGISSNLDSEKARSTSGIKDRKLRQKIKREALDDERDVISSGFSFGTFSSPSVIPSLPLETVGSGVDLQFNLGPTAGAFAHVGVGGYYTEEHLSKNGQTIGYPAYGYNYINKAINDGKNVNTDALLDFNRENDGAVNRYTNSLPVASYTYDIWNVAGQGIGQSIRSHHNNAYFVYDRSVTNKMGNGNLYFDFGLMGVSVHGGAGAGGFGSVSSSGPWGVGTTFAQQNSDNDISNNNENYEPYFYKVNGDITAYNKNELNNKLGGYEPMRIKFGTRTNEFDNRMDFIPSDKYISKVSSTINLTKTEERTPRSNILMEIKNSDLRNNNSVKELEVKYTTNPNPQNFEYPILLNRQQSPEHHLGAFVATNSQGIRYVYALPVVNKKQVEAVFSVRETGQPQRETRSGISNYNVKGNEKNTDKFASKSEIPEYPNTFLLTAVLGSDYIDVTNDGITADDLGYWIKFNYYKSSDLFKWRMPFKDANFNMGQVSNPSDDKGSYMYGEREQYYLHSIESKTHVAKFILSTRNDNASAVDEIKNNSMSSNSKKLDRIELYTRMELSKGTNAIPIKSVIFGYEADGIQPYSLCKGVPNNENIVSGNIEPTSTGKLTLRKLTFKYRNSSKSEKNYYKFDYSSVNPDYDAKNQDCWGNYSDRSANGHHYSIMFPYVYQEDSKEIQDANASAWSLNKITLPSGAIINVDYESDDYSYVQNRKVMQFYQLCEKPGASGSSGDGYLSAETVADQTVYPAYVKVKKNYTGIPVQNIRDELFGKDKYVYYKIKVDLLGSSYKEDYEYVAGYAELKSDNPLSLISFDNGYSYIRLNFEKISTEDKKNGYNYHPLSISAWNYLQLNRPDLIGTPKNAFPESVNNNSDRRKIMLSLLNPFKGLAFFIRGFYSTCNARGYGKNIDLDDSYIRMQSVNERLDPNGNTISDFKYGGGLRVREISITNDASSEIRTGLRYDYTTTVDEKRISSGVATYEPSVGGEENPLRQPLPFEVDIKTKSNYLSFTELPYNESLFPAPSVGYSMVTVRSINSDNVINNSSELGNIPTTGQTVYKFYTAKDFPVISKATDIEKFYNKYPVNISTFMYNSSLNYFYASQGYSIELNDMHGKPMAIESYGVDITGKLLSKPVSATNYLYRQEVANDINGGEPAFKLVNDNFSVIYRDDNQRSGYGVKSDVVLGVDFDIINDMRESVSNSGGAQLDVNVDLTFVVPFATAFPRINIGNDIVKTAVTNKIIFRSGILDITTQTVDGGGIIITKNKYFDEFTGQPLVKTVINEFGDEIENFSYPAYWQYDAMGPAFKNIGMRFSVITKSPEQPQKYIKASYQQYLKPYLKIGDELMVKHGNNSYKGVIMRKDNQSIWLDIRNGTERINQFEPDKILHCMVYRSGWRNQLSASVENYSVIK